MFVPDIFTVTPVFSPRKYHSELLAMPSPSTRRLSRMAEENGSLSPFSCEACYSADRLCIVSPPSRRCSGCASLNRGCSLARDLRGLPSDDLTSLLSQEATARAELSDLLQRLLACSARLETLSARRTELMSSSGSVRTQ
jgi:hypothetical protein